VNKITKNISAVVLAVSMISFVLPVMAQTTTTEETTSVTAVTASTTTVRVVNKLEEKIQMVKNIVMKIATRFDVNVRNLESLSSRISSRINKFDQQGKDTTEAKAKLNEANTKIQETKDAIISLQAGINAAISSTTPKKTFTASKDKLVKGVMDKIKAAHKALVETVVILAKTNNALENATSTTTTTTTTTP